MELQNEEQMLLIAIQFHFQRAFHFFPPFKTKIKMQ